jgi:AraC-like DNA-binding protein
MMRPLDHVIFQSPTVQVGAFTCAANDPRFRDSGPTQNQLVVFPRSAVWIKHAGSRAFVADARLATIYNRGPEYTRGSLSPEGDRCDWFAVVPEVALDIARAFDRRADDDPARPFRHQFGACSSELYLRQRRLFLRLSRGGVDPLEAEQAVLEVIASSLAEASGKRVSQGSGTRRGDEARRDLVERARAAIARGVTDRLTVATLARDLGTSAFHLCRVFRAGTGMTLHEYRLELRLRMLLDRLTTTSPELSRIALELGFASHSHMSALLRRRTGWTPSALRAHLATWASAESAPTRATKVAKVRVSPSYSTF